MFFDDSSFQMPCDSWLVGFSGGPCPLFIMYLDRFLLDEDFLNGVEVVIITIVVHDVVFVVLVIVRGGWRSTLFDGRTILRFGLRKKEVCLENGLGC